MLTEETINFSAMSSEKIEQTLKDFQICLTREEILKIQNEILKRPPTLTECVLWSIQGSEHCSYKSSRPFLKQFGTQGPNVILGPCEDAGIVEIARDKKGRRYGAVISHESHNHPSQIVPYEGAATGIGGNVRDVSCMGAKVIAVADSLRFGDIKNPKNTWIQDGVVSGISGYGNPIGVPNIGGDVYYDETYNDNCLVNVVTIGVLREDEIIRSRAPKNSSGYHLILVGKPTDKSGFGGASFASLELNEEEKEQNKGAVQEPNAFLKRHLLKSTYALFDKLKEQNLMDKVGFKDLGAGGIACAAVELADNAGLGAEIFLDGVPVSRKNLQPSVILCSETQERYMWVAHPRVSRLITDHYNKTFDLPKVSEGAMAKVVGKIRGDGLFIVKFQGKEHVKARASDITKGLLYNRKHSPAKKTHKEPSVLEPNGYNEILIRLLSHENIASRAPIYEKYDKTVQGITVIEPGSADAGVLAPFIDDKYPEEIRSTGIALSVDHNPRYGKINAYLGGVNAVLEAIRNVAAVGARPCALTDCLNFGNPEKEEQMHEFVSAVNGVASAAKKMGVPIISGNVSFYNESGGKAIAPSPVIACLGRLEDASKAITMHFKKPGSELFMVGGRKEELGGSVYYSLHGQLGRRPPEPYINTVKKQIKAVVSAIEQGFVSACHDISDGGIAVALSEMSFENEIGCEVFVQGKLRGDTLLFTETGGFVLSVPKANIQGVKNIFKKTGVKLFKIGETIKEKKLKFNSIIDIDLSIAKLAWTEGLRKKI